MGRPSLKRLYKFDGAKLTFEQIRARVPMLKTRNRLESELARGRNTRSAVLTAKPRAHRGGWSGEFAYRKEG